MHVLPAHYRPNRLGANRWPARLSNYVNTVCDDSTIFSARWVTMRRARQGTGTTIQKSLVCATKGVGCFALIFIQQRGYRIKTRRRCKCRPRPPPASPFVRQQHNPRQQLAIDTRRAERYVVCSTTTTTMAAAPFDCDAPFLLSWPRLICLPLRAF